MQNTSIHTCKHLYVWIKCTDITYIQTQDVVSKYQHNPQNCSAKSWYQTHEVGNDSGCDKNCSRCPETRHTRGLARARQNWTESKYRNHPDISGPPLQLAVWCCLKMFEVHQTWGCSMFQVTAYHERHQGAMTGTSAAKATLHPRSFQGFSLRGNRETL